jgi:hypothetical protein
VIIWKSKEIIGPRDFAACSVHRTVLDVSWLSFTIEREGKFKSTYDKYEQWRTVSTPFSLWLNVKCWEVGSWHIWYNGPHCGYSLGWLKIGWENWNCKKCGSDD